MTTATTKQRFFIRTAAGDEPVPRATSPNAALLLALDRACRAEERGTWEVVEYEDVIFRVHRVNDHPMDVRVEVTR